MTVLDRRALEDSPLADLHAIAAELSLDGYRRLRREELIDAILTRQGGTAAGESGSESRDRQPELAEEGGARRRRNRRGGRGREDREPREGREGRGSRDGREGREGRGGREPRAEEAAEPRAEAAAPVPDEVVEGVVELLPNGSGFLRVSGPEPSDDDVYISAAQVKRCELIAGDRVSGPRRAPQRSERFASLVRIDTINGMPADQVGDRARFDELPAEFPHERFRLGETDPTLSAIEFLAPFGRGSRVVVTGGPWSGKSHVLRHLARSLAADEAVSVTTVLSGVRPEELPAWELEGVSRAASVTLGGSADAQAHAVELAVDQARRQAVRGAHAVVVIDSLDAVPPAAARKALAAARRLRGEAGSVTVIAAAAAPLGGETTVIALTPELAMAGRFPALDLKRSGTLRAERLIGEAGAEAIVRARREALGLSDD